MSITKMDANGRVLLPVGIRYRLDLNDGDKFAINDGDKFAINDGDKFAIDQLGDGTIILKKVGKRMGFERWVNEKPLQGSKDLCANDEKR